MDFDSNETQDVTYKDTRGLETVEVKVKLFESEEATVEETEAVHDFEIDDNEEETQKEDSECGSISINKQYFENTFIALYVLGDLIEIDHERLESLKSVDGIHLAPSLEEQLLAVQKQLQALSQLPSAIQLTLDAVSKQLASIVGARENAERNGEQGEYTSSSKEEEDEPQTEEG